MTGTETPVTQTTNSTQVKGTTTTVSAQSQIPETYSTAEASTKMELTSANIIWFTNYYRVQNNVATLALASALHSSAQAKTADMFTYHYFDHTRPSNHKITFSYFINLEKYHFLKAGENLAQGNFSTSKQVVDAWMNSPEHKKNILDPAYTQIGVAVEKGILGGKSTTLITEHFGEPASACPTISQTTKTAIATLQNQLKKTQADIATKQATIEKGDSALDPNYNSLVDDYNALVASYDASVKQMGNLVALYNGQVKSFDNCLAKN